MEKTLVILAAGMGSRFGGLKQIEPIGPNGEIIADYSVYDALKAGFTKVVFVIKKENLEYFRKNITSKYQDKIKVEFAFQSLDGIKNVKPTRVKPLGTGHALYITKDLVHEGFVMINSDDFYGSNAFREGSKFLDESKNPYEYASVNYPFNKACSKSGSVNRGLVSEKNGFVTSIDESSMEIKGNQVLVIDKKTNAEKYVPLDQSVSLNFFVFKPTIYDILEKEYQLFTSKEIEDTEEFFITDVIKKYLNNKIIKIVAKKTTGKWLGMTYREDLKDIKEEIKKLIEKGEYPEKLWK